MQLKKKIVSLALAAALLVSVPVSAFATTGFNQSVFNGRDDIQVVSDDMKNETLVFPSSDHYGSTLIWLSPDAFVTVDPGIFLDDSYDSFILSFDYLGHSFANLNSIIFKIGDNRYTFSNCYTNRSLTEELLASEQISFFMKKETVDFMKDLSNHRNDEIKVRLNGSAQSFDFVLSDEAKNCLLGMYDLYASGGGTREINLLKLTHNDNVIVERNGKIVIGDWMPIIAGALANTY